MSTFLCKNGVRKEYFLTPTFIIEPVFMGKLQSSERAGRSGPIQPGLFTGLNRFIYADTFNGWVPVPVFLNRVDTDVLQFR